MTDHNIEQRKMTDCNECGHPIEEHGIDQYTGEPTKCPVYRQEDRRPPSHEVHR